MENQDPHRQGEGELQEETGGCPSPPNFLAHHCHGGGAGNEDHFHGQEGEGPCGADRRPTWLARLAPAWWPKRTPNVAVVFSLATKLVSREVMSLQSPNPIRAPTGISLSPSPDLPCRIQAPGEHLPGCATLRSGEPPCPKRSAAGCGIGIASGLPGVWWGPHAARGAGVGPVNPALPKQSEAAGSAAGPPVLGGVVSDRGPGEAMASRAAPARREERKEAEEGHLLLRISCGG